MTKEMDKVVEDSARGGFFLISGNVLSGIIMAIAAILIGRLLGPELYGEYNLALVVPTLLLLFASFGINSGITKFVASLRVKGENAQIARMIRYGLLFQTLLALGIFAVNFVFVDIFAVLINRPSMGFYIQIASILILFQVVYTAVSSAFIGSDKAEYSAAIAIIQAIIKTVISIMLVLLGFSIAGALIGYVASYVVASVIAIGILFFKILKPLGDGGGGSFVQTLKTLASYGMPLYVSALVVGFMPLYQQIVLAFFASNFDIGNFRAATNFFVLLSAITLGITTTLLPAFSKLEFSKAEELNAFFKRANKYACLLIVPIVTLLIIFSEQIVQVIYGAAFQPASLFLSIGCLPYFLVGMGYLTLPSLFNGLGETRITLKMTIINCLIVLTLAPILASVYAVVGVMITSLFSNLAAMLYAANVGRTKFKIEFDALSIARIYVVSTASAIPSLFLLWFTSMSDLIALIAWGVLYLLIYITLVPLTKIMGYYELQKATQITKKVRVLALIATPILKYQEKILRLRANL
jgi:O-antigen/teichoic acid export membrane protein